jgi:hypothetical protein
MLGRNTRWRQGDHICHDDAIALGIQVCSELGSQAIIISHDCDLTSDHESHVEVIVARTIEKVDNSCTGAKNPRKIHMTLVILGDPSTVLHVELKQVDRQAVDKSHFSSIKESGSPFVLPEKEKRCLKQWLASRYARPAFPNSFENRIATVTKKIERILKPSASDLVGLFVDLGPDRYLELEEGCPYVLSIVIVYDSIEGGPRARENAEAVRIGLESLFHTEFGVPEDAIEIALESCKAISDEFMSLRDVRRMDQWRLEHISLRSDDKGDLVFAGQMPP